MFKIDKYLVFLMDKIKILLYYYVAIRKVMIRRKITRSFIENLWLVETNKLGYRTTSLNDRRN